MTDFTVNALVLAVVAGFIFVTVRIIIARRNPLNYEPPDMGFHPASLREHRRVSADGVLHRQVFLGLREDGLYLLEIQIRDVHNQVPLQQVRMYLTRDEVEKIGPFSFAPSKFLTEITGKDDPPGDSIASKLQMRRAIGS